MGIVERAQEALQKRRVKVGDDDPVVGRGAGLRQFFNAFVNDRQGPRAEHVPFQGVNGQKIDPGLRVKAGDDCGADSEDTELF